MPRRPDRPPAPPAPPARPGPSKAADVRKRHLRPTGRPTLLTDELIGRICDRIAAGAKLVSRAAAGCGISSFAANEWVKRGELDRAAGHDTVYARFVARIDKARSDLDAIINAELLKTATGGEGPSRIAAVKLLRQALPEYRDEVAVQHGVDPKTLARLQRIATMTDEQLEAEARGEGAGPGPEDE